MYCLEWLNKTNKQKQKELYEYWKILLETKQELIHYKDACLVIKDTITIHKDWVTCEECLRTIKNEVKK